ncbi:MAG: hypothetical protein ABSC03_00355 [Verrucomicrobiota bacterium]|jgi:hypothetical protein
MQQPVITEVAIKKEGRFWNVKTDGKLLAVVLYRKGAVAVQELVRRLAGLPLGFRTLCNPERNCVAVMAAA